MLNLLLFQCNDNTYIVSHSSLKFTLYIILIGPHNNAVRQVGVTLLLFTLEKKLSISTMICLK
jgi:hypothetical protein